MPRPEQIVRAVVAALTALLLAGCTLFGSQSKAAGPTASPTDAASVQSSLRTGAVLTQPVVWSATVFPGDGIVQKVEFLIDRRVRFTELHEPYLFDEGRPFAAWPLGDGRHTFGIRAVTPDGTVLATTAATVTVRSPAHAGPPMGTYRRTVTAADQRRVAPYRDARHGAFGDVIAPGEWSLQVRADGVLVLDQVPHPADTDPFFEPFTTPATDRLTVHGVAGWLQPHPDRGNSFCEPEAASDYRWSASGAGLVITPVQHACADRDIALAGAWHRR